MYENWKILKSDLEEKQEEYSEVAAWCNANGYKIVDDGEYYKTEQAEQTPLTNEEIRKLREFAYSQEVDTMTAHIQRLRDTAPLTPEVEAEIAKLIAERNAKFAEIQGRYPYNEENL